jgi:hypothetical protein
LPLVAAAGVLLPPLLALRRGRPPLFADGMYLALGFVGEPTDALG